MKKATKTQIMRTFVEHIANGDEEALQDMALVLGFDLSPNDLRYDLDMLVIRYIADQLTLPFTEELEGWRDE
jgi:hypothetical protein